MDEPQVHTMQVFCEHGIERRCCLTCGRIVYFVQDTGEVMVLAAGDEAADHVEVTQ